VRGERREGGGCACHERISTRLDTRNRSAPARTQCASHQGDGGFAVESGRAIRETNLSRSLQSVRMPRGNEGGRVLREEAPVSPELRRASLLRRREGQRRRGNPEGGTRPRQERDAITSPRRDAAQLQQPNSV